MPTIKERLQESLKAAMKGGDKATVAYARNLHAAIRKREIDDRTDLDDAGVVKIIQSSAKQRQDSIEQFQKGGRTEMAEKEAAELKIIESYLPTQATREQVQEAAASLLSDMDKSDKAAKGKLTGAIMKALGGNADGAMVKEVVDSLFA